METMATHVDIAAPARQGPRGHHHHQRPQGWRATECEVGARPGERARFAINKESGKVELAPGVDRLIRSLALQRCRERGHFRVFGLKEPVGRKVLHLVLVE